MSRAARTIFVFGIYLIATGLVLVVTPNTLLTLLRIPPTTEPWIRVLGVVAAVLGAYYVAAARGEMTAFFRATLWGRALVLGGFSLLVLLHLAPAILIAFGLVDAAGAIWTGVTLRSQRGAA
jgi:hypothetical protein